MRCLWKTRYLIIGIVAFILPILTWFSLGFVEAAGTTLFFWAIGIPMILVGADKITPGGIWAVKKKSSFKPGKGHYASVYQFDVNGKITGHTRIWINDDAPDNADDADAYDYKVIQHYDQWGENTGYSKIPIKKK